MKKRVMALLTILACLSGSIVGLSNTGVKQNNYVAEASTLGEINALATAKLHLNTMAFSKKSLKDQLVFEGFSKKEANYAVKKCGANWKKQAAKKAQDYIDMMPLSKQQLVDQLKFEGFTDKQIKYGVKQVGY